MRKSRPQAEILRLNRLSLPTLLDTASPVPSHSPYFPALCKPPESHVSPHSSPHLPRKSPSRKLLTGPQMLPQELNNSADNALLRALPSEELRRNRRHRLLVPLKDRGESLGSLEISLMKVPLRARERQFPKFLKQRVRKTNKNQGISTDNPDYRSSSPLLLPTDDTSRLSAARPAQARSALLQSLHHMVSQQQHSKGLGPRFACVLGTTQRGFLPVVKAGEGVKSHTLLNL